MTTLYLVRHCEPNYHNHDDESRELTKKGLQDSKCLVDYFKDKSISAIYSSPYKRCLDTIFETSYSLDIPIIKIDNLKERKIDTVWIDNFNAFARKQWEDFDFKLDNGESLHHVQKRFSNAINDIIKKNANKNCIVSSHGTTISTFINLINPNFTYQEFNAIKSLMPFIVICDFDDMFCKQLTLYNIFTGEINELYSI